MVDYGYKYYQDFLNGDSLGFESLVKEYRNSLVLFIQQYVGDFHVAEDISQDVFVKLYVKKPHYSPKASFKTWLYTIAKRRGLNHAWLSWIPVANVWILGSIADQYRYVARGEIKSKRKVLLTLNIISAVLTAVMVCLCVVAVVGAFSGAIMGRPEDVILQNLLGTLAGMLGLIVPILGVAIAAAIIRYMALYDLYSSCDPDNKTVFLVIGILFGITEPVFLFLCRNKDLGMPPRRTF